MRQRQGGDAMRVLPMISTMLVLVGWLSLPAVGQEPTVAGNWTGTADGIAGSRPAHQTFTMVLAQNGHHVSGTYTTKFEVVGREGTVRVSGTFTDNKLSLTLGKRGRLQATVNGDWMTGALERGNNNPLRVSASRAQ
jgi:hypothetical protein